MAKLVSKTYGDALFGLALEKEMLTEVWEEVKAVDTILKDNPDFVTVLNHPRISESEKITLIQNIFGNSVSSVMTGFLVTVIEKGRTKELGKIFEYFMDRAREYNNIGVAYVSTAFQLSDEQKEQVEKRLIDVTDYVEFEMNYSVDPDLIGGMVIRIGDRILDNSIKNKLNVLSKSLANVQLN